MMKKEGFAHSSRLVRASDFAAVKERGARARVGPLLVSALKGEQRRLGVVVARRVGGAVERNRIRRIIREFFRQNQERFPLGDCVVVAGDSTSQLNNGEIRARLEGVLKKVMTRFKP